MAIAERPRTRRKHRSGGRTVNLTVWQLPADNPWAEYSSRKPSHPTASTPENDRDIRMIAACTLEPPEWHSIVPFHPKRWRPAVQSVDSSRPQLRSLWDHPTSQGRRSWKEARSAAPPRQPDDARLRHPTAQ